MPLYKCDEDAHRAIDARLWVLLEQVKAATPATYAKIQCKARAFLVSVEDVLVYPRWDLAWSRLRMVCNGLLIGGPRDGRQDYRRTELMVEALHATLTALVKLVCDASTDYLREKYIKQLDATLSDYLAIRGCSLPAKADQSTPTTSALGVDKETLAIAMLMKSNASITEIAKRVGVKRTTLYGWTKFMNAARAAKGMREKDKQAFAGGKNGLDVGRCHHDKRRNGKPLFSREDQEDED